MVALRNLVVECVFTQLGLLEDHFKCSLSIFSIISSLPVFKFQFTVKPWLTIQTRYNRLLEGCAKIDPDMIFLKNFTQPDFQAKSFIKEPISSMSTVLGMKSG